MTSLLLPTLLKRASGELQFLAGDEDEEAIERLKQAIYVETSARLLELAAVDQVAFRSVVGGLSAEQRSFMEGVVKAGRTRDEVVDRGEEENREPSIALRMNFGN